MVRNGQMSPETGDHLPGSFTKTPFFRSLLEIKLKEFARKEAGKVAPNLVFEVKIINDRQVICHFDVAGF